MYRSAALALRRLRSTHASRALMFGAGLGGTLWLMACLQPGNPSSLAMALLVLAAAPVSFVCFSLHRDSGLAAGKRSAAVRAWLCLQGVGLLAAMHLLNLVVSGH